MITRKSTCGLCKPTKKFKRTNTRAKSAIKRAPIDEELTVSLVKSYSKI